MENVRQITSAPISSPTIRSAFARGEHQHGHVGMPPNLFEDFETVHARSMRSRMTAARAPVAFYAVGSGARRRPRSPSPKVVIDYQHARGHPDRPDLGATQLIRSGHHHEASPVTRSVRTLHEPASIAASLKLQR